MNDWKFQGLFEIHITVQNDNQFLPFYDFCNANGCKMIYAIKNIFNFRSFKDLKELKELKRSEKIIDMHTRN